MKELLNRQASLKQNYLKNNKYCNIMELLSDELEAYSASTAGCNPVISYFALRSSEIYREFANDMRGRFVNNGGVIERKTLGGEEIEIIASKKLERKLKVVEDALSDYFSSMAEKKLSEAKIDLSDEKEVSAFMERTEEEHKSMIQSIYNKHNSMLQKDRF